MREVLLDGRFIVERGWRPVFEFFIVAEEILVALMKRLLAERVLVRTEIEIRIEQGVKHHLTKLEVGDPPLPRRFRTPVYARIQGAQRCFELIRYQLLEGVEHALPPWFLR